jgi:deazaflavin-dependent oxidoreductase (nitroreductase family)
MVNKGVTVSTNFQSQIMTYPAKGTLNRFVFKAPLILWRMGMGRMLGQSMLVLTTWGRKSRLPRHTALSYTIHDGKVYLAPGWPERADWYKNLQADPQVSVQLGEGFYHATARRVTEKAEFATVAAELLKFGDAYLIPWLNSLGIEPTEEDLIAKRDRLVLLALDWSNEPGPEPLEVDLKWVWGVIGFSYLFGWLMGRLSGRRK